MVILVCQAVSMPSSGRLVAALSEALHTRRAKGKVQRRCFFLMLSTTFQQPEGTLNTCLRKVRQQFCAFQLLGMAVAAGSRACRAAQRRSWLAQIRGNGGDDANGRDVSGNP